MSNDTPDSADDERSLFAKILRRSADELEDEQPDDPDAEQRAGDGDDEDDEMDEAEQAADPIDTALEEGAIEAGQASRLREVAERMDDGGVQTLVDAISENDLDVDAAVEMIEAYNGDEEASEEPAGMADTEDDDENEPEELRAEDDGLDEDAVAELRSRLDTLDALADLPDRIDDLEQRLDDLADDAVDEDALEQRLASVGETLDEEFEDLIQRADVVGTPNPKSGETSDTPLSDSLGQLRGES